MQNHVAAKATVWTETFTIRAYEVSRLGTISIQTVMDFLGEVAGNHAQSLGFSVEALGEQNLTWMLSQIRVQMDVYPKKGETLVIETWPCSAKGLIAARAFVLKDGKGNVIGKAMTYWMVIDLIRRRPIRLPTFLVDMILPERETPFSIKPERLKAPQSSDYEAEFKARLSDIDTNNHVNFVRYAGWVMESVPSGIHQTHQLNEIVLGFKAETLAGQLVQVATQSDVTEIENYAFKHCLQFKNTDIDLAYATTAWQKLS